MLSHKFFLTLAVGVAITRAQDSSSSLLCNSDSSAANSTSVASMNFNTAQISIHSWAVTVASSNADDSSVETSVWYDPGNAPYDNNTLLGYDLCAFFISNLPANSNRFAQSGSGGQCGALLPQSCQNTLLARAEAEAKRQTGDVENIDPSLPNICSSIAASFGDGDSTWPNECRDALGEGRDAEERYVGATVTSMGKLFLPHCGLTCVVGSVLADLECTQQSQATAPAVSNPIAISTAQGRPSIA